MKICRFASLLLISCALGAPIQAQNDQPLDIALWENGPAEKNNDTGQAYDESRHIYQPSIRVFLPEEQRTGRAVILCPGGGYTLLAYDHEGYAYADYFKHQGIALIVLKYRMPHGNHRVPLSDVCEAMRVVKTHADEWGINSDDIGIMGFSAGGHLASTFATHYPTELKPAFQILFYPVVSMDSTITHQGSRENLIGKEPDSRLVDYYSNEKQVNDETPRAFIALSDNDYAVPVENSMRYYMALHQHRVPASLHIYPTGGHGWGYTESFRFKQAVHAELADWLRSF